jgi:crossover junction endodeoxyribonuclease RuvC
MEARMIFLGLDPGVGGGVAVTGDTGFLTPDFLKFKDATERDIANWIFELRSEYSDGTRAVIEKVASSPQMGVVSSFTFGRSYGFLRGVLTTAAIPFVEVRPQQWQKDMGCLTKGQKNVSKAKAQQLYPELKVTHANADAVLLATYCRRHHKDLF